MVELYKNIIVCEPLELVPLCYNCVLNYGLGVVGPKMAMDFGSTKWNRCLVRGLSTDNPLFV